MSNADLLLESLEADDEVRDAVMRQRLPRFDVVEFRFSRTQAADVVVRRQYSPKQLANTSLH